MIVAYHLSNEPCPTPLPCFYFSFQFYRSSKGSSLSLPVYCHHASARLYYVRLPFNIEQNRFHAHLLTHKMVCDNSAESSMWVIYNGQLVTCHIQLKLRLVEQGRVELSRASIIHIQKRVQYKNRKTPESYTIGIYRNLNEFLKLMDFSNISTYKSSYCSKY